MSQLPPVSSSTPPASDHIYWCAASYTDIGGSKENQDESFIWEDRSQGLCVAGVLDGHGREVGRVAAQAARIALEAYFTENRGQLVRDPVSTLRLAFPFAHRAIKAAFRDFYTAQGWEVEETSEGYLTKRRITNNMWSCIHGGTSCSLIALVGDLLYSANVGDSSTALCAPAPVLDAGMVEDVIDDALEGLVINNPNSSKLTISATTNGCKRSGGEHRAEEDGDSMDISAHASPSAAAAASSSALGSSLSAGVEGAALRCKTLMITQEHSPECPLEFYRMRAFRPHAEDPQHPSMYVIYDSPGTEKALCPPVFNVDRASGAANVTNRGRYYKNVRNEWASIVATPITAAYSDALAFTRSLGDFHLQTYGVSYRPSIRKIEMRRIFDALNRSFTGSGSGAVRPTISVVVATDGVWDNWVYDEVTRFVLDESCIQATLQFPPEQWGSELPRVPGSLDAGVVSPSPSSTLRGVQRVAMSFIKRNGVYAKKNFGGDADNATAVVLYFALQGAANAPAPSQSP